MLKAPNPRFVFSYFTYNFGNGIHIVPKHIWEGEDPTSFRNLDLARGLPVVSGPYRLALLRASATALGSARGLVGRPNRLSAPAPGRAHHLLPQGDENKWVQLILANQMDQCIDLRPSNIKTLLDQNPNVTTWSGRQLPYGYRDWWPPALGFNKPRATFRRPGHSLGRKLRH